MRRREYLAATAGIALIAGCAEEDPDVDPDIEGGDSGGNDNGGTGEDGSDDGGTNSADLPTMARLAETTLPEDMNVNEFSEQAPSEHTMFFSNELLACEAHQGEVVLRALDDWNWNADSQILTKTLRDDLVFWNGDQFTAEDVWAYDEINRIIAPDASDYESITVVDDLTLEYEIRDPPNEVLIKNTELDGNTAYHDAEMWKPWIEQFEDASDQDERDELNQDLIENKLSLEEWVNGRGGTGVFEIVDWSETEITWEQVSHGNHRHSDDVDVERFKMHVTAYGSSQSDQLFQNGDIDVHTSVLDDKYAGAVPDYIENVNVQEEMFAYQMLINQRNHEGLQDRNVRRAMACVISSENVVTNFGPTRSNPVEIHAGMDPGSIEQYFGDDVDQLIDYSGLVSDHDRADYFLEKSGYSREDGTIYKPDGDEMETITFVTGSDFLFMIPSETAYLQMEEYGFPIEFDAIPRSQKGQIITEDMDDWDLSMDSHYAAGDRHASSYWSDSTFGYRLVPDDTDWQAWVDEYERSPFTGRKFKPEIPIELGQEDLSGDTKQVDVRRTYREARQSEDPERVEELIRDLSHMWNFDVPNIQVLYLIGGNVGNTRDYDWPSPEVLRTLGPNDPYQVIHDGQLTYSDRHK